MSRRLLSSFVLVGALALVASRFLVRTSALVGEPAPSLSHPALSGELVDLQSLKGRVIFINFWATWCPSCVDELPHLDELQRNFSEELSVVSIGGFRESEASLKSFLSRRPVTYPVIHLNESALSELVGRYGNFYQIPHTFAIDRRGRVRHVWPEKRSRAELIRAARDLIAER